MFKGYQYEGFLDFLGSLLPGSKYNLEMMLVSLATTSALVEQFVGVKGISLGAFIVLALVELVSGIYASVVVRKETMESGKMGRFVLKLAIWLVVMFVVNVFAKQYSTNTDIIGKSLFQGLETMRSGLFGYAGLEYLISVFENLSVISGKPKDAIINGLKDRLSQITKNISSGK